MILLPTFIAKYTIINTKILYIIKVSSTCVVNLCNLNFSYIDGSH